VLSWLRIVEILLALSLEQYLVRRRYHMELLGLLSSLDIFRMIKSKKLRWIMSHVGEWRVQYRLGGGGIWGKGTTWNLGPDVSGVLKWIFKKQDRGLDWIDLAHYRYKWRSVLSMSMNLRVIQYAGTFVTRWETVSFSSRTLLHEVIFAFLSARPN